MRRRPNPQLCFPGNANMNRAGGPEGLVLELPWIPGAVHVTHSDASLGGERRMR